MLPPTLRASLLATVLAGSLACERAEPPSSKNGDSRAAPPTQPAKPPLASIEKPPVQVPAQLDWLLFGGGSEPLSNQVSLGQDLAFAANLLAGRGLTLFASGAGAPVAVQETKPKRQSPELAHELARILGVPGAAETRYEATKLAVEGPSTVEQVLAALERALASGTGPLFVYGASHGDRGERPADNALSLWGGWGLKVHELAAALDRHVEQGRPTRFVLTACFGGGFAELAFVGADPARGLRSPDHCGLFAAPWDDEASGCDPNPDRRVQESYAIHFFHALAGKDRRGEARVRDIDIDGDAKVSLLEAHTFARIVGRSFDAPTTTSERYLREVARAPENVVLDPLAAPEDVAVVRALGEELELSDEVAARAKLNELEHILDETSAVASDAQKQADDAYYALRIALLERWPLLDHPWEARTQRLVQREGRAILRLLTESDLAEAQRQAARDLDDALSDQDAVRVERARVLRLVRAFETLRLASALKRQGGAAYAHYAALRRCERWVPPLRSEQPAQPKSPE